MKALLHRFYLWVLGRDLFIAAEVNVPFSIMGGQYGCWPVVPNRLTSDSIIYSFGVGEDASFDIALMKLTGAKIYAFDPTPRSLDYVNNNSIILGDKFIMHDFGLSGKNEDVTFYEPKNIKNVSHSIFSKGEDRSITVTMKTLKSIMQSLNHTYIDLLKMDIEGAEYGVIDDMINNKIFPSQLLIEFHHRFKNIKARKTKKYIKILIKNNYQLFYVNKSGTDFGFIYKKS
jgi:FkbM family methyltransferase